MKKLKSITFPILFSILIFFLSLVSCTAKSTNPPNNISPEARSLPPQFKSGKFQDAKGTVMLYRYFEPTASAKTDPEFPLILYLHGETECGTDNEKQVVTTECATIWIEPDHLAKNPAFVLAPQITEGSNWTTEPVYGSLLSLLKQFVKEHPSVDQKRIYLVGFSMGATGVWKLILKNPLKFAAAMPISGNADQFLGDTNAFAALKNFPVLVVHSIDDPISPVSGSENAIAALKAAGNKCVGSNTSIWGLGSVIPAHNAWYPAFHNYEVIYNWLFEQNLERTGNGTVSPSELFTVRDHGNGIKEIWDYALGTAYVIERPGKTVIIDAAASDGSIWHYIRDKVLVNKDADIIIIVTHNHFDHIGGLSSFRGSPQVKKVYVHKEDSDLVKMMLGEDASKIEFVDDGYLIPLDGTNIEVISVPGHSWGSIVMLYENYLFPGDAIGSGDAWLSFSPMSVEDYISSVQHLLDRIGDKKLTVLGGHTGEYRSPLTEEYPKQILACAKGLVDGSLTGSPYRRTIGGQPTLGYSTTVGKATIVHNLNNIHKIKVALRSLNVSKANISPGFAPYTAYYSATVDENVTDVTITPSVLANDYENLTINGVAINSGEGFNSKLKTGDNRFLITVTASDKTAKTYTVTLKKNGHMN